ncbi:hypothetical protein FGIG_02585 [Fasciola gigantica]|uniref:Ig-like domain-containing protein n=1 Tax=Fasciola gigantica TaxID=46835 RepID=A0A504YVR7_FASGI|nr:hypothetical protein FGIG_02585 [Fasciola gigantica]
MKPMNGHKGESQFVLDRVEIHWSQENVDEKIRSIKEWINGPGGKLLSSQTAKPYSFEEALALRKAHEQFEFKCMKALEDFASLCEYRKQNISIPELNQLDYMVQNYVDRLNKRTFFIVSCYTYFHLVEELLECEDNVYESIGWTEELNENIELLYQENCVGKNQVESDELLGKCLDIYKQAKTTYAYCNQLLETYTKLCETDKRKLPRNIHLSKNRLLRIWPRLETRIQEFRQRAEAAEDVYSRVDVLLSRIQEYLLEAARSPIAFDKVCGSPSVSESVPVPNETQREQLEAIQKQFREAKSLGIALVEKIPKGLIPDDPIFVGPAINEVGRLIRLKLYTLWLKIREYQYLVLGQNGPDQTTASELGLDTMNPVVRSRSTNSTFRRHESPFEIGAEFQVSPFYSSYTSGVLRKKRSPLCRNANLFDPQYPGNRDSTGQVDTRESRARSAPSTPPYKEWGVSERPTSTTPMQEVDHLSFHSYQRREKLPTHKSGFRNLEASVEPNDTTNFDRIPYDSEGGTRRKNRTCSQESNAPNLVRPRSDESRDSLGATDRELHQNTEGDEGRTLIARREKIEPRPKGMEWKKETGFMPLKSSPMSVRMKDLYSDLEECRDRLYDLVNATCLSLSQSATNLAKLREENNFDWTAVVDAQDINRISLICEETAGMNATIPAQEKFVSSLLNEAENGESHDFQSMTDDVKTLWKIYQEHLGTFYGFIELLDKGYGLLPRVGEFRTKQMELVNGRKQSLAALSNFQKDGEDLEREIAELMETERLYWWAEQIRGEMNVRPKLNWLIRLLKRERHKIKDLLDDLDLILANMRTDSSMETVDLGALLPLSPTMLDGTRGSMVLSGGRDYSQRVVHSASAGTLTRLMPDSRASTDRDRTPTPQFPTENAPPIPPRFSMSRASSSAVSGPPLSEPLGMEGRETPCRPDSRGLVTEPYAQLSWRFKQHLKNVVCHPGDEVSFFCSFVGPSSPSELDVRWTFRPILPIEGKLAYGHKEFIPVEQENVKEEQSLTHARLTLKYADAQRAGLYTVRVTNPTINTTMKSSATLQVTPQIVQNVDNVYAQLLKSETDLLAPVSLTVRYKGFITIPHVKWSYAGKPVDQKRWQIRTDLNESSIFSNSLRFCDQGALKLEPPRGPPSRSTLMIGESAATGFVREGQPLTIRCPLDPKICLSDCSIDWLHNGKVIYTFNPVRYSSKCNQTTSAKSHTDRGHQFQREQTVWRTYIYDGSCALITNSIHQTDKGTYLCRIYSEGQVHESEGEVKIRSEWSFIQPLTQMSVRTGQPVTLSCQLRQSADVRCPSETESLHVQWFKNDELLNPYKCLRMGMQLHSMDGHLSLTIQRVSKIHAGLYRCEVSYETGIISTQCDLEVYELVAPKVVSTEIEPSGPLYINQTARIIVTYTAEPVTELLWLKDGRPLSIDPEMCQVENLQNECSLVIYKVHTEDSGIYQLQITNEAGSTEARAMIRVMQSRPSVNEPLIEPIFHSPTGKSAFHSYSDGVTNGNANTIFLLQPSNVGARSGESVYLICILKRLQKPIAVEWFHNDNRIAPTKNIAYRFHSNQPTEQLYQLEIRNISRALGGSYKVRVIQLAQSSTKQDGSVLDEAECWVTVDDSTDLDHRQEILPPEPMDGGLIPTLMVKPGEPFELICHVTGSPTPAFCWLKDGMIIDPSKSDDLEVSLLESVYRLAVKQAKLKHSGEWTLVCYNAYGVTTTSSTVAVVFSNANLPSGRRASILSVPELVGDKGSMDLPPPPSLKETDGDLYTQRTDEPSESLRMRPSTPSLMEPPEFKSVFTDVACRIGETVQLHCVITGCPTPLWQAPSMRRRRHTRSRSHRVQTGNNVLTRVRSEGSLVHRCPVCHTAMTPSSTPSEPRLGCVHSTRVTERIVRYDSVDRQSTPRGHSSEPAVSRRYQTDLHQRHSHPSDCTVYDTVPTPVLRTRARRRPSQSAMNERQIPIRILSSTPVTKTRTHVVREYSMPVSPAKLDAPEVAESHFSVVESSDGEGSP